MHFCPDCDNKLYVNMRKGAAGAAGGVLGFLYCKYCGDNEAGLSDAEEEKEEEKEQAEAKEAEGAPPPAEDMCLYRSNFQHTHDALYFATLVNEHSLHDPTLPTIPSDENETEHACADATLRYVRYDQANMKYIYLCDKCRDCFTLAAPNTPLFAWKLQIPGAPAEPVSSSRRPK